MARRVGYWALYGRERADGGDVARRSASWTLNERERAGGGDVARQMGVLAAVLDSGAHRLAS